MEIRERHANGITTFELEGRFTANDRPGLLKEAVAGAVSRGARRVLLDLSGVKYIDSTRLGELIAAHVSVARQGGTLRLVRTPPRIVELLEMVGLAGVFEGDDTAGAAARKPQ
jgi:anti-sigma B factor antagonist